MAQPAWRRSVFSLAGCLVVLAVLVLVPGTAQATLVSLENVHSTGQAAEGAADPYYTLISAPDTYPDFDTRYPDYPNLYIPYSDGYPFIGPTYPWASYALMGAAAEAHWIAPQADYRDTMTDPDANSDYAGVWEYQTSFYIQDGVDPATALLYGAISSDNCTLSVLINGVPVSGWDMGGGSCLAEPHYFQIGAQQALWTTDPDMGDGVQLRTSAFQPGWNTIVFQVTNYEGPYPNPSGLIVWLGGEGDLAPEASTVGLMTIGLGALAWFGRRKRSHTS